MRSLFYDESGRKAIFTTKKIGAKNSKKQVPGAGAIPGTDVNWPALLL
jgi:hypothetical protein